MNRSPAQAWKTRIIPVFSDPFAIMFNGKRGEPGVLHQVAHSARSPTEITKNAPVSNTGLYDAAGWASYQCVCKSYYRVQAVWLGEGPGIRGDSDYRRQHLRRYGIRLTGVYNFMEPGPIDLMQVSILTEGIQEDVDIG